MISCCRVIVEIEKERASVKEIANSISNSRICALARALDKDILRAAEALKNAFDVDRKVLIEESIIGREIECSVLGNDSPEASNVLGEIVPHDKFYSYEAKYIDKEGADLIIPAKINPEVSHKIREAAVEAFLISECRGMARVDFFLCKDNSFILNEINTLPGFTKISMFPKLWESSGLTYKKLLDRLIELAIE